MLPRTVPVHFMTFSVMNRPLFDLVNFGNLCSALRTFIGSGPQRDRVRTSVTFYVVSGRYVSSFRRGPYFVDRRVEGVFRVTRVQVRISPYRVNYL